VIVKAGTTREPSAAVRAQGYHPVQSEGDRDGARDPPGVRDPLRHRVRPRRPTDGCAVGQRLNPPSGFSKHELENRVMYHVPNRKALTVIGVAVLAVAAPACSSTSASTNAASSKTCAGNTIAYASFEESSPYFAVVDKGVEQAAAKAGLHLYMVDNNLNATQALTNANTIAAHPGIKVVLESNYYQTENGTIGKIFSRAHLPTIAVDIAIPGDPYYGANNTEAGKLAGQGLVAAANQKWGANSVDLALVEEQAGPGQQLIMERTDGIVAGIKAADPSLPSSSIVVFQGSTDPDTAGSAVAAALSAHPTAKHIIIGMLGDANGVAASKASQEDGRSDQVLIAGQGGDGVGVSTLEGPPTNFIGTTDYRPSHYGDDLVALACKIIEGKKIPMVNYIHHIFLTRNNVRKYYPHGNPS
jgi:ribose transport system substrate-binding protein